MLFNTYGFIFGFLPVVLAGFYVANAFSRTAATVWLGLASLFFYGWWNWHLLPLLVGSIAFNFGAGALLSSDDKRVTPQLRRWVLILAITGNLALLGYCKYMNFLVDTMNVVLPHPILIARIILPIGISFYTFTQIAFLIDSSQGLVRERSFANYLLFVTYFPHLIAGPIIHHSEVMPQFRKSSLPSVYENLAVGLSIFVIGLFKKAVIADGVAGYATTVFDAVHAGAAPTFLAAWCGAVAYMLQLYFDFSGYSDMAVGLSRAMGIRLPINFNSPLKAECIIDFWQRWHMTLTRWLTAYLYNPLATKILGWRIERGLGISSRDMRTTAGFCAMVALPIGYTMSLAGIWHGAGLQYLVFGLLHAVYLTINHAWRIFLKRSEPLSGWLRILIRLRNVVLTYLAVLVADVFFRSSSVHEAIVVLRGMAGQNEIALPKGLAGFLGPITVLLQKLGVGLRDTLPLFAGSREIAWLIVLLGIVWLLPNTQEIMQRYRPALLPAGRLTASAIVWRPNLASVAVIALLAIGSILSLGRESAFIYFQF
jgi:alginate O-acetyltransferase complex protein AlgI